MLISNRTDLSNGISMQNPWIESMPNLLGVLHKNQINQSIVMCVCVRALIHQISLKRWECQFYYVDCIGPVSRHIIAINQLNYQ